MSIFKKKAEVVSEAEPAYPNPEVLYNHLDRRKVGWLGEPYYVEVSTYDTIYLAVKSERGYVQVQNGEPGYIHETTDHDKVAKVLRKYLAIAWERNRQPRYSTDTSKIFDMVLAEELR